MALARCHRTRRGTPVARMAERANAYPLGVRRRRLLAATALAAIIMTACSSAPEAQRLPNVELTSLDGSAEISLDSLRGPAVINLWATTCAPCVKELPEFQSVADEHPEVAFYGINVAEQPNKAREFLEGLGVTYAQFQDPEGYVSSALGVGGIPTTLVIDATGTVIARQTGAMTGAQLGAAIAEATG